MAANPHPQPGDSAEQTYMQLRWLLAGLAFALPLVLVGGGALAGIGLLPQLSAYYFTHLGDIFVAMLWAIGFGLVAYKGFTAREDIALNIGGVLLCMVGLFHMPLENVSACLRGLGGAGLERSLELGQPSWLHFACAIAFYAMLGYVMVFCSHASLVLLPPAQSLIYRRCYTFLGLGFVASILVSYLLYYCKPHGCDNHYIVLAEVGGLLFFAIYWVVKIIEIRHTGADRRRHEVDRRSPRASLRSLVL